MRSLKDLWFDAEDVVKKIQINFPGFFEVAVKILKTVILFILCSAIFMILIAKEFIVSMYKKIKSKLKKDNAVEELDEYVDEYGAREEIVLPDKVEPGELDKLDKVRKWM
tara:strand:+ start:278 stop:607 length:330 start_codon:yes stop_codon:yes gene_type:complete